MKPKVIKPKANNNETGCCFRSCGGIPGIQSFEEKQSQSKTEKKLKKI